MELRFLAMLACCNYGDYLDGKKHAYLKSRDDHLTEFFLLGEFKRLNSGLGFFTSRRWLLCGKVDLVILIKPSWRRT